MPTVQQETVVIGLGDLQVSNKPDVVLTCLGLGSCVGVGAYDSIAKVGGMTHIVLPFSEGREVTNPGKFADTAVPALIDEMVKFGASKSRLVVKIAGGAQMSIAKSNESLFKTGMRNVEAAKAVLEKHGLSVAAESIGGSSGRTLRLFVSSGEVTVTSAGKETESL